MMRGALGCKSSFCGRLLTLRVLLHDWSLVLHDWSLTRSLAPLFLVDRDDVGGALHAPGRNGSGITCSGAYLAAGRAWRGGAALSLDAKIEKAV